MLVCVFTLDLGPEKTWLKCPKAVIGLRANMICWRRLFLQTGYPEVVPFTNFQLIYKASVTYYTYYWLIKQLMSVYKWCFILKWGCVGSIRFKPHIFDLIDWSRDSDILSFVVLKRLSSQTQVQVRTWGTPFGTPVTRASRSNSCGKILVMLAGKTRLLTAGSSNTDQLTATSGTDPVTVQFLSLCLEFVGVWWL